MMISHSHAIAPSKNALHYLRQILFHWPCEQFHHPHIANCIRLNIRRKSNCTQTKDRSPEVLKKRQNINQAKTLPNAVPTKAVPKYVSSRRRQLIPQTATSIQTTTTAAIAPRIQERVPSASSRIWILKCCRSVLEGKLSEAREGFLEGLRLGENGEQVKIVGKAVMKALRKRGRHSEIPHIFHQMYIAGKHHVDTYTLNVCLEAYIHMGMYSKVRTTWEQHRGRVKPDLQTMKHRMQNLIATGRLQRAEKLLRRLLWRQRPPWLADATLFALLLGGVKIVCGSFHKMERIFTWMLASKVKPHIGMFNILIEAAIGVGRLDIARGYARMKLELGIKHNADTYGIFLALYARNQNWEATTNVLRKMEAQNIRLTTPMFNMLLKGYSSMLPLDDLGKFFDEMEARGVSPDLNSFNIMVHSCVREWDEDNIKHWVRRMIDSGIEPDATTTNTFFQTIRTTRDAVPSLLRRIYAVILGHNDTLINTRTKGMLTHSMYKGLERVRIRPMHAVVDQTKEQEAMESAIQQGQFTKAIDVFQKLLSKGIKPSIPTVTSAVRATLFLPNPDRPDAYRLLQTSEERGVKISKLPILRSFDIHLPPQNTDPTEAFITASRQIREAYEFLESADLPITHDISVHTAWRLIEAKIPRAAILLLHEVSKTSWGANFPWEKKSLTVLMKAYIDIGDTSGLGWVVDQLIASKCVPDHRFFDYLKRAMEVAETEEQKSFLHWLEVRCSKHRVAMRGEAKRRMQFLWYLARDWKKS